MGVKASARWLLCYGGDDSAAGLEMTMTATITITIVVSSANEDKFYF